MIGFTAFVWLAAAADVPPAAPSQPTITVVGVGTIETPPDVATLSIDVRGEGKTPDDASSDLARRQKAIIDGVTSLTPDGASVETGNVRIEGVRSPNCKASDDDETPVLGAGPCAIAGYIATSSATIRMASVKEAGTAVGLAGRLGAAKAEIDDFSLKSPGEARRQATAAAFADARARATIIAQAGGARLGVTVSVRDEEAGAGGYDVVVTGSLFRRNAAPAPIRIDVAPAPVKTTTRLFVTFALEK